jgi:RNA polymerase sigma factor for flagellar operon FliA
MSGIPITGAEQVSAATTDELALWHAFKDEGSAAARESLFALFADFARSIARRHHRERSRGDIDIAELYQYAYAGLLEALDRFEPQRGVPFRPFAAHRISGSILDAIPRLSEVLEQVSWRRRLRRERLHSLAGAAGEGTAAVEQLAELALGLALGFMLEGTGLFSPGEADGSAAMPGDTAYDSVAWKETLVQLRKELQGLPEREATILSRHYLDGVSFDQLSALLSVSKARISQLHRQALLLLRKRMRERGHFRLIR